MSSHDSTSEEYIRRTPQSRALHERLRRSLPGGETRSITYYAPYPVTIARGDGPTLIDADGNRYLDVLNNYTSLVHGHAYAPIVEAVRAAALDGTAYPAPHPRQLELAELLVDRYPGCELVRLTSTGTEAAILALRIARHATGRRRIVLCQGGFHGTGAEFLDPNPEAIYVPYNDPEALKAALDAPVAAVFVEAFLGSGGVIPPADGYLQGVQDAAHAAGALFVLDEVQALRNAYHGIHGALGLRPDLILMGKIIGGGLPAGAVGGRAALLELTAASRATGLSHSGTFNGNVLTSAAGLESLRHLDEPAIARLNANAARLATSIEAAGARVGLPVTVTRFGSIMQMHFLATAPANAAEASRAPAALTPALHLALLVEGVFAAPRGMLNLSTVLSDAQVDAVAGAYERAFARVAAAAVALA